MRGEICASMNVSQNEGRAAEVSCAEERSVPSAVIAPALWLTVYVGNGSRIQSRALEYSRVDKSSRDGVPSSAVCVCVCVCGRANLIGGCE